MRIHPFSSLVLGAVVLFTGLSACDSAGGDDSDRVDLSLALSGIGQNVIVPTYEKLSVGAENLHDLTAELAGNPSSAALSEAQEAWRQTRAPWESSEGFLFGPVDQFGLDPSLDTWPVDEIVIQSILGGSDTITPDFVANQDVDSGLKGFHVIEYLLFGTTGNKEAGAFTQREFDYLAAAAEVLASDAAALYAAWSPSGGNYVANIINAGAAGSQFVSQKDGILTLADAVSAIADEVGSGKMQGPLDEGVQQVESRFSGNSKSDFQNNIRSIQHIYLGDYEANSGAGLADIVAEIDPALDQRIVAEIDAAIDTIGAIPGDFRTAITDNRPAVEQAIDAVIVLKTTLEEMTALLDEEL